MAQAAVRRRYADGPKKRHRTVLTLMEEAAIVALRIHARLLLDDVYIALNDVIPHLTRSSLHRCLKRHDISLLPKADREKPRKFNKYEIGYFHIDIAELRYEGRKGLLFVAVDQACKLVFAPIYRKATKLVAAGLQKSLIRTVLYRNHIILSDNGVQFIQREHRTGLTFSHIFRRVALENNIAHRLTKPYHPWTCGQAERMVRTIRKATVKSFHYSSIDQLRRHPVAGWLHMASPSNSRP